jgi:hypothetical protein
VLHAQYEVAAVDDEDGIKWRRRREGLMVVTVFDGVED